LGYAEGNNRGIKYAYDQKADYIIILNPDTIVDENWLTSIIQAGERDPSVGIIGSKILIHSNPELINSYGHILNCLAKALDNGFGRVNSPEWSKEEKVISVCGASLAIKRNVIEKIGLFDKTYFNYYEDVDLCLRARYAGFEVIVVPESIVYHKISRGTEGRRNKAVFWSKRNQYLFMFKHYKFREFLKYFPMLMVFEYRQIYNSIVFNQEFYPVILLLKALASFVLKLPLMFAKKLVLIKEKRDFNLFDFISSDPTIPIMPDPHPDYKVFVPQEDKEKLPSRIFMGCNDDILGHGWYNLYKDDKSAYRWFGKRANTFLKVKKSGDYIVQIHASAPLSILKVPKLVVCVDGERIGEREIDSHEGEWHTLHFPVTIKDKDYIKITLELDDFVSIKSRGWIYDFGCTVNEIGILEDNSSLLRSNLCEPAQKEGLYENGHVVYENKITDHRYNMELLEMSEKIDGRSFFYLKVRVKNTSKCPWLYFNHNTTSYVALGMRLFDEKNKHHPQSMAHFKLNRNILPGEEDIMTLQISPLLREGPHTIRLDMVEEFVCWFEEMGAKPLEIKVDL